MAAVHVGIVGGIVGAHIICVGAIIVEAAAHNLLNLALVKINAGAKEGQGKLQGSNAERQNIGRVKTSDYIFIPCGIRYFL